MATTSEPHFLSRWWQGLPRPSHTQGTAGPIVLDRRHVYIFLTKQGFAFGFALLVMLLGSMNYNNNMGYMLTFILASMSLVSILHTHRLLHRLRIEAGHAGPAFAGEAVPFQLWLDNRNQPARIGLHWQRRLSQKDGNTAWDKPVIIDVAANQHANLVLKVPSLKRGRLPLGQVKVNSDFPLGLFRVWSYVHLDLTATVYPAPLGQRTLPSDGSNEKLGEGQLLTGSGDDFMGYRDYKPGDSPRHIDWKAVARGQEWLIKEFGGSGARSLTFNWSQVQHLGDLEAALSQLCLWVLIAEQQQLAYGLSLPHIAIEQSYGEAHRNRCLTALALYGESSHGTHGTA